MFVSLPVQQVRWQQFLDSFVLSSTMPDMMNVKYLVYSADQYAQERVQLGDRYQPVFRSSDGDQVVLENRAVLPKGWLVPSAAVIANPEQRMGILQNPAFNPKAVALVETPPPIPMEAPDRSQPFPQQSVNVTTYEGEHIAVSAHVPQNALLVLGEKYYKGWKATVDGKPIEIHPVNTILRGVYLTPGDHKVEFRFDPLPFKIGKYLTLASFALFAGMLVREWRIRRVKE
jgi:hypothetical protein